MKEQDYQSLIPRMRDLADGNYFLSSLIVLINLLIFALAIFLMLSPNILCYLPGIFILAFQMNHSYTIMHECGHSAFLRRPISNKIWGFISAFFCLYPFEIKKHEHMLHHRCTGGFDEPVAKKAMKNFALTSPLVDKVMIFCWKFWIPIFTANELVTTWKASLTSDKRQWRFSSMIAIVFYATIGTFIVLQPNGYLFILKFAASAYLYMIALEFFTMPHHVPSVIENRTGSVPFHEQDKYTQSCTPWPAPFDLLLMLNFNYHVVHHLYPYVHFTKLKEAHALLGNCEPTVLDTRSEWDIMLEIRRRGFRDVFKKYYIHQTVASSQL